MVNQYVTVADPGATPPPKFWSTMCFFKSSFCIRIDKAPNIELENIIKLLDYRGLQGVPKKS